MNPIYVDLHIHTSDNANSLNKDYDVANLVLKIREYNSDNDFLISFTDHNTINCDAYMKAKALGIKLILGVELHIKHCDDKDAYHCHAYFRQDINEQAMLDINAILDKLYPEKLPRKDDQSIPNIQDVLNAFDDYEMMLLPHAGQTHGQFNYSIPHGKKVDNAINRSIYYNQFDGFTARSNKGLENTHRYFEKLGIDGFVNLLTCSDNYSPSVYPKPKANDASEFIPTWMFAEPTYDGVRLSLSESSRLCYQKEKPGDWSHYINHVELKNANIDINVNLTEGLNVVIGGSSSGKTLFVDSLYRKIHRKTDDSVYEKKYNVSALNVVNTSNMSPYYIPQNYVVETINNNEERSIDKIDLIRSIFPGDADINLQITNILNDLNTNIRGLIDCVKDLELTGREIVAIQHPGALVTDGKLMHNPFNPIMPSAQDKSAYEYGEDNFNSDYKSLENIRILLRNNPFVESKDDEINAIEDELKKALQARNVCEKVAELIRDEKEKIDNLLTEKQGINQSKVNNKEKLYELASEYVAKYKEFHRYKHKLISTSYDLKTQEVESMGHHLSIKFNFKFNQSTFLEVLNGFYNVKFNSMDDVVPDRLFQRNFKKRPNVGDYGNLAKLINSKLSEMNNKSYEIKTREGRNFKELSAGWKTSIILDLILGYKGDNAPIIIDQPEDNLAVKYINEDLVNSIKKVKQRKQIIIVSHNATIPMLADAQNIIICRCEGQKITIRNAPLEGAIDGNLVLDYIAENTDGGKTSIKKRVKKYNLKKFS